jgi:hypothetical protein
MMWNPALRGQDSNAPESHEPAAYQAVRRSVRKVLEGENPGAVCYDDHGDWYREMFGPSLTAGLLRTADLAGYREFKILCRIHHPYVFFNFNIKPFIIYFINKIF